MGISSFKKSTNLNGFENGLSKLDYPIEILLTLYQRAVHWLDLSKHYTKPIESENALKQAMPISPECSALRWPTSISTPNSPTTISCTSSFYFEKKYIAVVTIAMRLEFAHESTKINPHYYEDFKKIAHFFRDCEKTMVLFEGYEPGNKVFDRNPLAHQRFKAMAKYLFDHFDVPPSHFCPICTNDFIWREENSHHLNQQDSYQVKFLFSYEHLAKVHYLLN